MKKIQRSFLLKTLKSIGINGTFRKIRSNIYLKLSASIIHNGDKLVAFPRRAEVKQECPLSPLLFNIVPEMLALAMRRKRN